MQLVGLQRLGLPLDVPLHQGKRLLPLVQLQQGLGQKQGDLRVLLVVDQPALEGPDRQLVLLGGEEDHAEVEIGGGRLVAQDPGLVRRGEPVGGPCRPAPPSPGRYALAALSIWSSEPRVQLAQLVLGQQPARGVGFELGVGQHLFEQRSRARPWRRSSWL